MKKLLKPALLALGGLSLFAGAMVGFALLQGAAPSDLPVLGRLFSAPETEAEAPVEAIAEAPPLRPAPRVAEARAGLGAIDVFRIDAPFTAAELQELADALERRNRELDQRLAQLAEREQRSAMRAEFLDEQYAALARLRTGLEDWENELGRRESEIEREETAQAEREEAGWKTLAALLEKGDAAELAPKLETYSPGEAARILRHLKPARAKELLDALPPQRWKEYAEAFRQM